MKEKDIIIAVELKKRLSEAVKLLEFKVFGSRARGDNDEFADMDVFLEVEELDDKIKKIIYDISWEVGFNNGLVISVLFFSREEIENTPVRSSHIMQSISFDGVAV